MCQTLCVTNIVPRVNFNVNKKDHYHQSRHEDTTFLCVWNLELFYKSKCIRIYFFQDLILGLVLIISKFQVYIMHYGNIYVYACQNANTFTIDYVLAHLCCVLILINLSQEVKYRHPLTFGRFYVHGIYYFQ